MNRLQSLLSSVYRQKAVLSRVRLPVRHSRVGHHDGPPQPFDNMPFDIPNRYAATCFFAVFYGLGLWAPFLIVWYSMAKKTL